MIAAIPYTTFPEIDLGPLTLRTFGLLVALGVVVGAMVAARLGEDIGIPTDDTISLATRLVIAGVVGARLTWVITHLSQIDSPLDVIAVWEGGLQFSGGFIAAILVGLPAFRRWKGLTRWRMLDRVVTGLAIGVAIGRIGCYAVGEHLGATSTSFFLATRYDGGATREGPPAIGQVIHNTALYECLSLLVLFVVLLWLLRRKATPSTAIGTFLVWYGTGRFLMDFLRGYDDKVLGLTGAQWMCLVLVPAGLFILTRVRPRLAALEAAEPEAAPGEDDESLPSSSGSAEA